MCLTQTLPLDGVLPEADGVGFRDVAIILNIHTHDLVVRCEDDAGDVLGSEGGGQLGQAQEREDRPRRRHREERGEDGEDDADDGTEDELHGVSLVGVIIHHVFLAITAQL